MQHSLWHDIIVANNESTDNMKALNMSTGEDHTVPRTSRVTYMNAHALQALDTTAQSWRTAANTPRPTPTLPKPHEAILALPPLPLGGPATLNFGCGSRVFCRRRERRSCARAAGQAGLSGMCAKNGCGGHP